MIFCSRIFDIMFMQKKGPGYLPVKKRRYQGMTVECAEQEANDMLELLPHDRLEKCVFKQNSAEVNSVNDGKFILYSCSNKITL